LNPPNPPRVSSNARSLSCKGTTFKRHGRACPGHPRLSCLLQVREDVDVRHKGTTKRARQYPQSFRGRAAGANPESRPKRSREHLDSGSGAHAPSRNDASLGRVAPTRPFLNGTLNRPAYRVRGPAPYMPPARDKLRMAAKKKAANTRREPSFDDDDDDSPELRVTGSDRASPTSDRTSSAKPRKRRARKKRPARGIGARIG